MTFWTRFWTPQKIGDFRTWRRPRAPGQISTPVPILDPILDPPKNWRFSDPVADPRPRPDSGPRPSTPSRFWTPTRDPDPDPDLDPLRFFPGPDFFVPDFFDPVTFIFLFFSICLNLFFKFYFFEINIFFLQLNFIFLKKFFTNV